MLKFDAFTLVGAHLFEQYVNSVGMENFSNSGFSQFIVDAITNSSTNLQVIEADPITGVESLVSIP